MDTTPCTPPCKLIRQGRVEPTKGMQKEEDGDYNADRFNQFPVVQQGGLVLNVVVGHPSLDLVS